MTDAELLDIANRVMDVEGECNVCDSLPIYRAIYAVGLQEGVKFGAAERSGLESELSALRAEVEVMRRAVDVAIGLGDHCPPGTPGCRAESEADCLTCKTEWAISEARKGEG